MTYDCYDQAMTTPHRSARSTRTPAPDQQAAGDAAGDSAPIVQDHAARTEADENRGRLGLPQLARAAGVSPRTVRYYIAEGLLPPPRPAGPASAYDPGHLDRLRLIGRLKAAYLPLKEIRRRLTGLTDDEVRALLDDADASPPEAHVADDAAAYLDRVLGPRPTLGAGRAARLSLREPPPLQMEADASSWLTNEPLTGPPPSKPEPAEFEPYQALLAPGADTSTAAAHARDPTPSPPETEAWRRIPLGDDAELLIRDEAYRRRPDRVEWLVAWARRVFG